MGRYLRTIIPGESRDPTMTYVKDASIFRDGMIIRTTYKYELIVRIDPKPEYSQRQYTVFAQTIAIDPPSETVDYGVPIYDLRTEALETGRYGAIIQDGDTWRMPTREEYEGLCAEAETHFCR